MQPAWILPKTVTEDDVQNAAGFVYQITNVLTGRRYIGKKYCHARIKGKLRPSAWRSYWGSSKILTAEIKENGHQEYTRHILRIFQTRGEVDYAETRLQFVLDVIHAKLPDGSPKFYNQAVGGRWFRAPARHTAATKAKSSRANTNFTDDQVRTIRTSRKPQKDIALEYGVSISTISLLRNRKRCAYVPDHPA